MQEPLNEASIELAKILSNPDLSPELRQEVESRAALFNRALDGDLEAIIEYEQLMESRRNRFVDTNPDPDLWISKP